MNKARRSAPGFFIRYTSPMRQFSRSFANAFSGLRVAWKEERNFRIDFACAVLVLVLGWYVGISSLAFAFLVIAIGAVLTAEVFNTALEELCDKFQPTQDPHIKKIKDLAAAAVLITSLGALVIGILVFVPHLTR